MDPEAQLLRQPGDFEGAGVVAVVAAPDHPPTFQLVDQPLMQFDGNSARLADLCVLEQADDTVITGVY
jgi:hypothetical protein